MVSSSGSLSQFSGRDANPMKTAEVNFVICLFVCHCCRRWCGEAGEGWWVAEEATCCCERGIPSAESIVLPLAEADLRCGSMGTCLSHLAFLLGCYLAPINRPIAYDRIKTPPALSCCALARLGVKWAVCEFESSRDGPHTVAGAGSCARSPLDPLSSAVAPVLRAAGNLADFLARSGARPANKSIDFRRMAERSICQRWS